MGSSNALTSINHPLTIVVVLCSHRQRDFRRDVGALCPRWGRRAVLYACSTDRLPPRWPRRRSRLDARCTCRASSLPTLHPYADLSPTGYAVVQNPRAQLILPRTWSTRGHVVHDSQYRHTRLPPVPPRALPLARRNARAWLRAAHLAGHRGRARPLPPWPRNIYLGTGGCTGGVPRSGRAELGRGGRPECIPCARAGRDRARPVDQVWADGEPRRAGLVDLHHPEAVWRRALISILCGRSGGTPDARADVESGTFRGL